MHARSLGLAVLSAALCITSGLAADIAAPLIGNTLTITREAEEPVVLHFNADGTYTRNDATGKWEEKDGTICMTADATSETYCEPLEADHGPGDTWQQKSADGSTVTMSLTAGQ